MNKNIIHPGHKKRLTRAVWLTITAKVLGLLLLFFFAFSPSHRPKVDAATTAQHLFNQEP